MREAGIAEALRGRGLQVVDLGDVPRFRWRPDRERPRAMHVPAVASAIEAVAEKVALAAAAGHIPLVLGGDCTIELGTVLGMRQQLASLRLVYLDAHPDLNTPESVVDGALDWMGVAHLLGVAGALPELAARRPHADARRLRARAARDVGADDRARAARDRRARDLRHPRGARRRRSCGRRVEALALVGDVPFLVHLDTDVIDFAELPLAENTDRNVGLAFETVMRALDGLLALNGVRGAHDLRAEPAPRRARRRDGADVVRRLAGSFPR